MFGDKCHFSSLIGSYYSTTPPLTIPTALSDILYIAMSLVIYLFIGCLISFFCGTSFCSAFQSPTITQKSIATTHRYRGKTTSTTLFEGTAASDVEDFLAKNYRKL